ncbi:MAG: T9SS type A sorting domain-containing protein [Bacteroidetes bacterium]|nr:T9SS type A sorting domain-containing protein [Bacteroidota bacterium]
MKKTLLFIGLLGATTLSFAQVQRNCGTMTNLQRLRSVDQNLDARMQEIENHTQQIIQNSASNKTGGVAAVVNIPVVVHVIYNTAAQNISDAQIQSQIEVLNEDFRRLNADKVNTPTSFTSVAADAEITFCLATKAPNGAATNGIIRKSTTVTSWSTNDLVKYSAQGGSDAWPAASYLNIWVCNLGGGVLGYAQFPGGAAVTDGVVINYNYFGRGYATLAPYNKGRTGAHEVGHWLNLRHIWGDAACGDDLVNDTPTQQASNYGCPAYPNKTCSNTTSGDQFMNYMDYTDDACMNMFSAGQKTRMKALFATGGARASLLNSTACATTSTTASYCSAKGANVTYEWISNVKLATLNNASGANGGYADFTNLSTNLVIGSSNVVVLTPSFASTVYPEYFRVYIDYNKDKDFTDAGELVYTSAGVTQATSGSFTVPSTVTAGNTRMRVMMKDGAITGPCEQYTYGETEDYSVNFVTSATSGSTLTLGAGTSTTANAPYGTYYMDERSQFIVTKAELVNAGYTSANSLIKSLAFNISSLSAQVMNGFTIKIGHTSASSFGTATSFATSTMTTVYSANYTPVAGWNTHTFGTGFNYNGTSNLIIDICWNNSSYTNDSRVFYTATADNKTLFYKADVASGAVCGNISGSLSTARPNMKFSLGASSSTGKIDPTPDEVAIVNTEFGLYPNPASSNLSIAYSVTSAESNVGIQLFNVLGALVLNADQGVKESGSYSVEVDLNGHDLSSGVYFCRLNVDGKVTTKRFIISK